MTTKKKDGDLGAAEVQKKVDEEIEQGFAGTVPDPTPNQNYTVGGVLKDKPTPETNADAASEAHGTLRRGVDDSNFTAGKK